MTLGAENVQTADGDHFVVLFVGLKLVAIENLGPLIGGNDILIAGVVPNRALGLVDIDLNLALRGA